MSTKILTDMYLNNETNTKIIQSNLYLSMIYPIFAFFGFGYVLSRKIYDMAQKASLTKFSVVSFLFAIFAFIVANIIMTAITLVNQIQNLSTDITLRHIANISLIVLIILLLVCSAIYMILYQSVCKTRVGKVPVFLLILNVMGIVVLVLKSIMLF